MSDKSSKHGGSRIGAGRKKGSSIYGESTKAIRVPESLLPEVKAMLKIRQQSIKSYFNPACPAYQPDPAATRLSIPLFNGKVSAGFPSPADDYVEKTLDLNELLIKKPAATFFVRAEGESMLGAGIHPDDILVVDRSIEAIPGKIIICALHGELTVKRLKSIGNEIVLAAENKHYPDIVIPETAELIIWGVVTNVIHPL